MSQPDDDDPAFLSGPTLGADGKLEGRFAAVEPPPPPVPTGELELEVVAPKRIEPRVEHFRDAPADPRRRRALAVFVVGLVVIGAVAGFVVFVRPQLTRLTPDGVTEPALIDQLHVGAPEPLIISSTPTGARLTINGEYVGDTPWAGDNRWSGTVKVTLEVPGYQRWETTLPGGAAKTIDAKLAR